MFGRRVYAICFTSIMLDAFSYFAPSDQYNITHLNNNTVIVLVFCFFVTEASKVIMQFVAEVSGKGQEVDRVKEQLLQSNPVLEGM